MADVYTGAREINPGTEMNGNGESRPQVPTWSVANAKEAKPQIIERSDEPEVSKPEAKVDADLSNGSHPASADADAQSDIDELLTGGDAEPEPPAMTAILTLRDTITGGTCLTWKTHDMPGLPRVCAMARNVILDVIRASDRTERA
ncbi:unnamed protein product [Aureobasidium pullulans]|nr:unnamed protein product [Aureobasidium pullulans]